MQSSFPQKRSILVLGSIAIAAVLLASAAYSMVVGTPAVQTAFADKCQIEDDDGELVDADVCVGKVQVKPHHLV